MRSSFFFIVFSQFSESVNDVLRLFLFYRFQRQGISVLLHLFALFRTFLSLTKEQYPDYKSCNYESRMKDGCEEEG